MSLHTLEAPMVSYRGKEPEPMPEPVDSTSPGRPLVERAAWAIVFLLGTVAGLFLARLLG